ncbi:hypothetical protein SAMN05920897_107107 [Alkalispirochaeta americana]|uniref:Uncharacterized protein n=2 Tax=Alkalispirochaeta americana TaxID=159291 RepID=A0A1N6S229_9SPIO|nr:hypothetical protein SAMN05920897_107107 [Alkalispirochaeta americana]
MILGGGILFGESLFSPGELLLSAAAGGVLLALVYTYMRLLAVPVVPLVLVPLMALVLLLFSSLVFFRAELGLERLYTPGLSRGAVQRDQWSGVLLHGRGTSLYVSRDSGPGSAESGPLGNGHHPGREQKRIFSDVVLVRHREVPRLRVHREISWDTGGSRLILPGGDEIGTASIAGLGRRALPPVLRRLTNDLLRVFRGPGRGDSLPAFALRGGALTAALALVWVVVRLTRWPLLNGVAALGWIRLILAVPRGGSFAQELWQEQVPFFLFSEALLWGVLALVLVVIALRQPPFRRWQRDTLGIGEKP